MGWAGDGLTACGFKLFPAQPSPAGWWGGVGAGDESAACRFKLIPVQHGGVVGWVAGGIVSCRLNEPCWFAFEITIDNLFDQNLRCR